MTTSVTSAPVTGVVAAHPSERQLAMFALSLGGFGIGTAEFVAMGLLPEVATSLDVTEPAAGHLVSAYALGVVVGAPLLAAVTARMPRRALLLALVALFTLANLATVAAPTYESVVAARFVAGLPHGAYLGVAATVAAYMAPRGQRAKAIALTLLGLTCATVVGVPIATWVGQSVGWRGAFALVAALGVVTFLALRAWVPDLAAMPRTSPATEVRALRRVQVWLTLGVGMIGGGGMFAVYTYVSSTLTEVSGLPRSLVPVALMVFGAGMVFGNLVGGRLADRGVIRALYVTLASSATALALFVFASHSAVTALIVLFCIGATALAVTVPLQTRLMDVAADAQTLAASLSHATFNLANATGAWLGGVVIAAGLGYPATAAAGAALAVGGLVVLTVSVVVGRGASRR